MTFEQMERTMQFILEHQGKFSADIDQINETLARHNEAIVGLVQVSRTLVEHQVQAEARTASIEEKMGTMIDAHRETDERLSTFITFVEKYISSRNGGQQAAQ